MNVILVKNKKVKIKMVPSNQEEKIMSPTNYDTVLFSRVFIKQR